MSWNIEIGLKSNKKIGLFGLKSISEMSSSNSSIKETTDFESFHLVSNRRLSFVGEKQVISLNSSDIEYVSLHHIK